MKNVFLAVFLLSTAIHLYASLRKDTKIRNSTKPFILLSLLGFYVLAARTPATVIIFALIFSWLGDILLIPKGIPWFTAGGIAFMISHGFFIAGYCRDVAFSRIPGAYLRERRGLSKEDGFWPCLRFGRKDL